MIDKKTQKYDRQLRLWQSHGQEALEECSILMIGSNNLACEMLKNLVLPGIGSFTIMDDKIVQGEDVGSNFFLSALHLGDSRAKASCQLLQELNSQVKGNFIHKNTRDMVVTEPAFFSKFTMVVYCGEKEADLLDIGAICFERKIPFLYSCIYGFIGYCRFVVPEHTVIESHPESIYDLRLDKPWKKLADTINLYDFSNLTSHTASHIPFPIILLETIKHWKLAHSTLPVSRQEKHEFQSLIKFKMGNSVDDENVREAISYCYKLFAGTHIPTDLQAILNDSKSSNLTKESSEFWILVQALKRFIDNEGAGLLPNSGIIPDMKADTDSYVSLQRIYREKAVQDAAFFQKHVEKILLEIGRENPIKLETIERFCKNSNNLKIFRSKSLAEEYVSPISSSLRSILIENNGDAVFYLLLRAVNRFHALHGRYPGTLFETFESDSLAFEALFSAFIKEIGVDIDLKSHTCEFIRAGACELPSIAAIVGGIGSQEIIKLITHQYVPLDNTIIFNGVKSTTCIFKV